MRNVKAWIAALAALALLALPGAAAAKDRDRDRLPDRWEKRHGLSTKKRSAHRDPDSDGLVNRGEHRARTHPRVADTNGDGTDDGDEDRDRDRVDAVNELQEGTSPTDADSDEDGLGDGSEDRDSDDLDNADEDATGNDPTDPDTDGDGVEDGAEQSGAVVSFDEPAGELVIRLANGTMVSGLVDDETEIECESEDALEDDRDEVRAAHGGDDEDEDEDRSGRRDGSDDEDRSGPNRGSEDDEDDCGPEALVEGARVHEAEADLTAGGLVFTEIELVE